MTINENLIKKSLLSVNTFKRYLVKHLIKSWLMKSCEYWYNNECECNQKTVESLGIAATFTIL